MNTELQSPDESRRPIRTVHVAVYDGWADWEVGHLTARVNNPAWQRDAGSLRIRTVGESLAPVTTMELTLTCYCLPLVTARVRIETSL